MKTVFLSVGAPANAQTEAFVTAVRNRMRAAGLEPKTVGDGFWDNSRPLKGAEKLMALCHGAAILALERYWFAEGIENRGEGGRAEARLGETLMPTIWNQIEGTMAYTRRLPLLVIAHGDLVRDGLLQDGYDWYVLKVDGSAASLSTPEFNGVFESWCRQVQDYRPAAAVGRERPDPEKMSVGELVGLLKPAQLWSLLGTLAALIAGAFALGAKLI